jgi:hypothetical protein
MGEINRGSTGVQIWVLGDVGECLVNVRGGSRSGMKVGMAKHMINVLERRTHETEQL